MVRKIFALASASALTGLVATVAAAGCSETEKGPGAQPTADAGADAKPPRPPTTTPPEEEVEPTEPETCMVKDAIDATKFPYTKAERSKGACSEKEAQAISDFFKETTDADKEVLVSEWGKSVSPKCATCVFSDGTGATWTPIISKDDKLDSVNRGGCIEIQSGKEACGRTYQQATQCRLDACLTNCKTQGEFTACLQDASAIFTGPCQVSFDAMMKECGSNLGAYETACSGKAWTFEGPITVQCVTGGTKSEADGGPQ